MGNLSEREPETDDPREICKTCGLLFNADRDEDGEPQAECPRCLDTCVAVVIDHLILEMLPGERYTSANVYRSDFGHRWNPDIDPEAVARATQAELRGRDWTDGSCSVGRCSSDPGWYLFVEVML